MNTHLKPVIVFLVMMLMAFQLFSKELALSVAEMGSNGITTFFDYPTSYHMNPLGRSGGLGMSFAAHSELDEGIPSAGSVQASYRLWKFTLAHGIYLTDRARERYNAWEMYSAFNIRIAPVTIGYTYHYATEGELSAEVYQESSYHDFGIGMENNFGKQHIVITHLDSVNYILNFNLSTPEDLLETFTNDNKGIALGLGLSMPKGNDIGVKTGLQYTYDRTTKSNLNISVCNNPRNLSFGWLHAEKTPRGELYGGLGFRIFPETHLASDPPWLRNIMLTAEFGIKFP